MENKYLIDTNILIYYYNGVFDPDNQYIDELFRDSFNISIISKIEFLGFRDFQDRDNLESASDFI